MKKFTALLFFLLMLFSSTAFAADFSNLVILHTNDTHGFDQYGNGSNGMAVISALKKDYEAQGFEVLLLDSGDAIQDHPLVNFSQGASAIAFMNAARYDAGTLGNHEFDYGQDVLLQRVKEASFPIVSTNVIVDATGDTLVKPYAILQKGEHKIGILGLTTPNTVTSSRSVNTYGLTFLKGKELWDCTQRYVDDLKSQGCDLIIVLSHLGSLGKALVSDSYAEDILAHVHGIDILLDGHDHLVKNNEVNGVIWAETGCHTEHIGRLLFEKGKWYNAMLDFGEYTKEDPDTKSVIDRYAAEIAEQNSSLGTSEVALTEGKTVLRSQETNIGDLIADAFLWQGRNFQPNKNIDAAIINSGAIRTGIPKGDIPKNLIHNIMPFDNQLCLIQIQGEKLLEVLEAASCLVPEPAGGFAQVSGIEYTIDTRVPFAKGQPYDRSPYFAPLHPGSRVTIHSVGGKPFSPDSTYAILVTDFVLQGGDSYGGLTEKDAILSKTDIGCIDSDALLNYIQEALHGTIGKEYEKPQGRIHILYPAEP